ncbi:MAG: ABC transporter substrate-binding protein [Acutalibacteraceae bacterium]|nr:ABC transporter substrate-binding protein [Acutalibacteraceae bacterium]
MKKILAVLLVLVMVFAFVGCGGKKTGEMNVYVLSGPTGIGAVNLRADAEKGLTKNTYNFSMVDANDEIVAAISDGKADIAAVATNLAATLYNKTNGGVTVLAVNTTSVLSVLTNGTEIKSVADLKGKTIFSPGQGANPEYILRYVLKSNGIDPDKDVTVNFVADGSQLPAVWAKEENKDAVILAPQPVATSILTKYTTAKAVLDMGEEWDKVSKDSSLMMGCVIVRNEYLKNNEGVVKTFLKEYEASINKALADKEGTGLLCEEYGIIPKAALATKAIDSCGLKYIDGNDMKTGLDGYLKVMYDANPKSVGGKLPNEDFYYAP